MANKVTAVYIEKLYGVHTIWCDKDRVKAILSIPGVVEEGPFNGASMTVILDKRYREWDLIAEIKAVCQPLQMANGNYS